MNAHKINEIFCDHVIILFEFSEISAGFLINYFFMSNYRPLNSTQTINLRKISQKIVFLKYSFYFNFLVCIAILKLECGWNFELKNGAEEYFFIFLECQFLRFRSQLRSFKIAQIKKSLKPLGMM